MAGSEARTDVRDISPQKIDHQDANAKGKELNDARKGVEKLLNHEQITDKEKDAVKDAYHQKVDDFQGKVAEMLSQVKSAKAKEAIVKSLESVLAKMNQHVPQLEERLQLRAVDKSSRLGLTDIASRFNAHVDSELIILRQTVEQSEKMSNWEQQCQTTGAAINQNGTALITQLKAQLGGTLDFNSVTYSSEKNAFTITTSDKETIILSPYESGKAFGGTNSAGESIAIPLGDTPLQTLDNIQSALHSVSSAEKARYQKKESERLRHEVEVKARMDQLERSLMTHEQRMKTEDAPTLMGNVKKDIEARPALEAGLSVRRQALLDNHIRLSTESGFLEMILPNGTLSDENRILIEAVEKGRDNLRQLDHDVQFREARLATHFGKSLSRAAASKNVNESIASITDELKSGIPAESANRVILMLQEKAQNLLVREMEAGKEQALSGPQKNTYLFLESLQQYAHLQQKQEVFNAVSLVLSLLRQYPDWSLVDLKSSQPPMKDLQDAFDVLAGLHRELVGTKALGLSDQMGAIINTGTPPSEKEVSDFQQLVESGITSKMEEAEQQEREMEYRQNLSTLVRNLKNGTERWHDFSKQDKMFAFLDSLSEQIANGADPIATYRSTQPQDVRNDINDRLTGLIQGPGISLEQILGIEPLDIPAGTPGKTEKEQRLSFVRTKTSIWLMSYQNENDAEGGNDRQNGRDMARDINRGNLDTAREIYLDAQKNKELMIDLPELRQEVKEEKRDSLTESLTGQRQQLMERMVAKMTEEQKKGINQAKLDDIMANAIDAAVENQLEQEADEMEDITILRWAFENSHLPGLENFDLAKNGGAELPLDLQCLAKLGDSYGTLSKFDPSAEAWETTAHFVVNIALMSLSMGVGMMAKGAFLARAGLMSAKTIQQLGRLGPVVARIANLGRKGELVGKTLTAGQEIRAAIYGMTVEGIAFHEANSLMSAVLTGNGLREWTNMGPHERAEAWAHSIATMGLLHKISGITGGIKATGLGEKVAIGALDTSLQVGGLTALTAVTASPEEAFSNQAILTNLATIIAFKGIGKVQQKLLKVSDVATPEPAPKARSVRDAAGRLRELHEQQAREQTQRELEQDVTRGHEARTLDVEVNMDAGEAQVHLDLAKTITDGKLVEHVPRTAKTGKEASQRWQRRLANLESAKEYFRSSGKSESAEIIDAAIRDAKDALRQANEAAKRPTSEELSDRLGRLNETLQKSTEQQQQLKQQQESLRRQIEEANQSGQSTEALEAQLSRITKDLNSQRGISEQLLLETEATKTQVKETKAEEAREATEIDQTLKDQKARELATERAGETQPQRDIRLQKEKMEALEQTLDRAEQELATREGNVRALQAERDNITRGKKPKQRTEAESARLKEIETEIDKVQAEMRQRRPLRDQLARELTEATAAYDTIVAPEGVTAQALDAARSYADTLGSAEAQLPTGLREVEHSYPSSRELGTALGRAKQQWTELRTHLEALKTRNSRADRERIRQLEKELKRDDSAEWEQLYQQELAKEVVIRDRLGQLKAGDVMVMKSTGERAVCTKIEGNDVHLEYYNGEGIRTENGVMARETVTSDLSFRVQEVQETLQQGPLTEGQTQAGEAIRGGLNQGDWIIMKEGEGPDIKILSRSGDTITYSKRGLPGQEATATLSGLDSPLFLSRVDHVYRKGEGKNKVTKPEAPKKPEVAKEPEAPQKTEKETKISNQNQRLAEGEGIQLSEFEQGDILQIKTQNGLYELEFVQAPGNNTLVKIVKAPNKRLISKQLWLQNRTLRPNESIHLSESSDAHPTIVDGRPSPYELITTPAKTIEVRAGGKPPRQAETLETPNEIAEAFSSPREGDVISDKNGNSASLKRASELFETAKNKLRFGRAETQREELPQRPKDIKVGEELRVVTEDYKSGDKVEVLEVKDDGSLLVKSVDKKAKNKDPYVIPKEEVEARVRRKGEASVDLLRRIDGDASYRDGKYTSVRGLAKEFKLSMKEAHDLMKLRLERLNLRVEDLLDMESTVGKRRPFEKGEGKMKELLKQDGVSKEELKSMDKLLKKKNPTEQDIQNLIDDIKSPEANDMLNQLWQSLRLTRQGEVLSTREKAVLMRESIAYLKDFTALLKSKEYKGNIKTLEEVYDLIESNQRKLAHQAIVDKFNITGSDHGTLHILEADMGTQEAVWKGLEKLRVKVSPLDRIIGRQTIVDHDMGYTVLTARSDIPISQYWDITGDHPVISSILVEANMAKYTQIFGRKAAEIIKTAVLDHSNGNKFRLKDEKGNWLKGRELAENIAALADCLGSTVDVKGMRMFTDVNMMMLVRGNYEYVLMREAAGPKPKNERGEVMNDAELKELKEKKITASNQTELADYKAEIKAKTEEFRAAMLGRIDNMAISEALKQSYREAIRDKYFTEDPRRGAARDFGSHAAGYRGLEVLESGKVKAKFGVNENYTHIRKVFGKEGDSVATAALVKVMGDLGISISAKETTSLTVNGKKVDYDLRQLAKDLQDVADGKMETLTIQGNNQVDFEIGRVREKFGMSEAWTAEKLIDSTIKKIDQQTTEALSDGQLNQTEITEMENMFNTIADNNGYQECRFNGKAMKLKDVPQTVAKSVRENPRMSPKEIQDMIWDLKLALLTSH